MSNSPTSIIETNGIRTSYRVAGEGPVLLFIHAFPFNQHLWDAQFEELQKDFRVITYDVRGFGESGGQGGSTSIDQMAGDLIALMDQLEIRSCVACGISMGGYILMNAGARFPERFSGLILCDTQCIADSEEGKKKRADTIGKIKSEGLEKFAGNFVETVFSGEGVKDGSLTSRAKSLIMSNRAENVTAALQAIADRKESCNALKQLSMPVLVICGKEDTITPRSQSELIFSSLEKADLKVIENAGHLSSMEQPEKFNSHIREFMKQSGK